MAAPVTTETIDKSGWACGPWQAEVDLVSVADAPTGYAILLNRDTVGGHWLAYVGVPPSHVAFGVADPLRLPVGAMGGLSYAGPLAGGDTTRWWLGFSCGSAGALQPLLGTGAVYITQAAALQLALQLARDVYRFNGSVSAGILNLGALSVPTVTPSTSATSTAASVSATAGSTSATVTVGTPSVANLTVKA